MRTNDQVGPGDIQSPALSFTEPRSPPLPELLSSSAILQMEKGDAMTCVRCGSPFEQREGPGRPALYCGEACKRLAEHEVRRIDRRLARYESDLRLELADRRYADEADCDNLGRS